MLGLGAAVVLGAVMCVAGGSKIAMGDRWPIEAAALGAPRKLAPLVPWVEIALGALLIVRWAPQLVGVAAAALLLVFTGLIILQLRAGRRPVCACFGSWSSRPLSWMHVLRNLGFVVLAVVVILV